MSEINQIFEALYVKNAPSWSIERDEDGSYKYHATRSAFILFEAQQTEIDQLKAELALCREENKGVVGRVSELKKHAEMLIGAAKSWTYSEGEKNILLSQADDIDRILNGEKALRGEDESTN